MGDSSEQEAEEDAFQEAVPEVAAPVNPRDRARRFLLRQAVENHVDSFNALATDGLKRIVDNLAPVVVEPVEMAASGAAAAPAGAENDPGMPDAGAGAVAAAAPERQPDIEVVITNLTLSKPANERATDDSTRPAPKTLTPRECRLGHLTYGGRLTATITAKLGDNRSVTCQHSLGTIPVMVRSKFCTLNGLTPQELVRMGEDETEAGGYFVIHGLERVIRLLIMPKVNYPMAISRPSYKNRGPLYTKYAVLRRCMRTDGTTQTNTLHYTSDGSCYLRFSQSKEEWLIPLIVVLHACAPSSDAVLGELLAGPSGAQKRKAGKTLEGGYSDDLWTCVLTMINQQNATNPISSQREAQDYLGETFRAVLGNMVPRHWDDSLVGQFVVQRFIMVHTEQGDEKVHSLVTMFHKLLALVTGDIDPDSQDTMCNHDVLTPGNLYASVLKENLENFLGKVKAVMIKATRKVATDTASDLKKKFTFKEVMNAENFARIIKSAGTVGRAVESFISTGNVSSRSGLDLMQMSGYTIVADKLNHARFSSHFGSVHRGQYFAEMKTTTVRKLLPETWGFLCPVHTPDGSPCGLLNHLAAHCRSVTQRPRLKHCDAVYNLLVSMGMHTRIKAEYGESDDERADSVVKRTGNLLKGKDRGMPPMLGFDRKTHVWVELDGKPLGHIEHSRLKIVEQKLRECKVLGRESIPPELEIVAIQRGGRLFPGLFLFLGPGRLVRPVKCLRTGRVETIGALEQLFMNISVLPEERIRSHAMLKDVQDGQLKGLAKGAGGAGDGDEEQELPEQLPLEFSHEELEPTRMLSLLAALTPFSNHNQSPRNMYQCQMLKQTMGTPYHNHIYRTDNKVFRILNPQRPMVRTKMYEEVEADSHPTGTNAVVAVITYTGYDMEDAMLINKGSYERGFAHGAVYKTKIIEAAPNARIGGDNVKKCKFTNRDERGRVFNAALDADGLPPIGTYLQKTDPMYCTQDHVGNLKLHTYHDEEPAYVEQASLIDGDCWDGGNPGQRLLLKLRYQRNPVVGDKFSSRHGQKGVMSLLWPSEDMPFTDGGITPDILFNPHGFPSRMTIGMLIESIAGKAAAKEGRRTANGTTFRGYSGQYDNPEDNNEDDPFLQDPKHTPNADGSSTVGGLKVADYFGNVLVKHGFQKLGTERMYSGIHGTELETEIFVGVIYYQRLRHLVLDKAQARSRGPNDRVTHQPVKGRKRGGGIRFGEMERDSLIAHGAAYLLHDRLFRCSDFDTAYVCPLCGSIVTPQAVLPSKVEVEGQSGSKKEDADLEGSASKEGDPWECPPCTKRTGQKVRCYPIPVPWVFRYLVCELAAMNVKIQMRVTERGRETSLSHVSKPQLCDK